jgi:D-alanyl-D-alanine carboxypeptidase
VSPAGAIRAAYATTGFERGGLGYPTSNETCGLVQGGCYQNFQGGAILWSPTTGARATGGEIRNAYATTGFERGGLGYPTSNETCGLVQGGCYQNFQGGAILWSPTTGARVTGGEIRNAYAATGFETGRLGYPTSNQTCTTPTNCRQTFQRGTITWTPTTGTRTTYR